MIKTLPCGIELKLVDNVYDVFLDMALTMLESILKCHEEKRNCVMIVPVGPTEQYPILAELVNRLNIPLHHVHFFNMDEYLITPTEPIAPDHFMSFHARMNREFYDRVKPELVMPESQRHFPEPGHEAEYDAMIEELGGVELCLGGLGINGHLAFNEPPEAAAPMTAEAFGALGTRVLPISRETRVANAIGDLNGAIDAMPTHCVTIGISEILSARKIRLGVFRDWHRAVVRQAAYGEVSAHFPVTLVQNHPDACIYVNANAAIQPF